MAMTIAVTRNAPGRFRGFFASCMLEVTPGVYIAPRMKKAVRERVWKTVLEWSEFLPADAGIALFWKSRSATAGLGIRIVGWPKKELIDHEGLWLATRNLTAAHDEEKLGRICIPELSEHAGTPPDSGAALSPHLPDLPEDSE